MSKTIKEIEKEKALFLLRKGISNHPIYKNVNDGKLWQFSYYNKYKTFNNKVNSFPGSYADIIPEYDLTPSELKIKNIFIPISIMQLIEL